MLCSSVRLKNLECSNTRDMDLLNSRMTCTSKRASTGSSPAFWRSMKLSKVHRRWISKSERFERLWSLSRITMSKISKVLSKLLYESIRSCWPSAALLFSCVITGKSEMDIAMVSVFVCASTEYILCPMQYCF